VIKLWKETGKVIQCPLETGRPCSLTSLEITYLESLIEQQPDIYVHEMSRALFLAYNVEVHDTTITCTLYCWGFVQMKARFTFIPCEEEM
ncbi:hypothetical protein L208DRAFT_1322048, partial [Tricholoma matsutake]